MRRTLMMKPAMTVSSWRETNRLRISKAALLDRVVLVELR
jgi:hypothetical protein